VGALVFGRLSDRLGQRNPFMVTLAVYLVRSGLTAPTPWGFRLAGTAGLKLAAGKDGR
jgi:MFS family permease